MKKRGNSRKFSARHEDEREHLISQAWCNYCNQSDLGLVEPQEYEGNGMVFLEGRCALCGNEVVLEIEPALS